MHRALPTAILCLAALLCPAGAGFAGRSAVADHATPPALKRFIQADLAKQAGGADSSTRVSIVRARLGGPGGQALVYVTGADWCGSGGCTLMVLEPRGRGWAVIGDISIARPPVLRLRRTSHGYRDLAVFVEGGGIIPGYEADLPFNGRRYAGNPSVPPARPLKGKPRGGTLIASDAPSEALYN